MRRREARGEAPARTQLTRLCAPQFGYSVYRQVIGYYSGEEDAYGASTARLRRACSQLMTPCR
jgi:hypothetical protein